MAAIDPYNYNKPQPRRRYPEGYVSPVAPAPLPVPAPALPAPVDGAYTGRGSPDFVARRSVYTPGPGEASAPLAPPPPPPTVVDGRVSAPPAPPVSVVDAQYESAPVRTEAQAREYNNAQALEAQAAEAKNYPQGVSRRGDGIFEGKGSQGERAFSDSAYAPQFAGVAGASPEAQKVYANRFQQDRPVQNASDYEFQRAREAEIKAAGEDYKKYVAAGSPRTGDGRGLNESDFIQRRRRLSLEDFLGSEAGGSGSRASDRGGLLSGVGRRDGGQADAIAANTALLETAKGKQGLEKGDIEIDKLANERADTQFGELSKRYTENPDLARQFGPGVSPSDAAAAELAMNMTLSQTDPLSTEVGRRGVAILERIAGQTNADRSIFAGRDGDFPVGSAPAALENYSVDKRGLGARLINKLTGDPDFVLQSPAFDKRDGKRNVPIDPNDPNAERFTNYETGLPGILGGQRGQEFLLRYQDIAKRRNKKE